MTASSIILIANSALTILEKAWTALEARKQSKEMTTEEEAEFDDLVARRFTLKHWEHSNRAGE